MGPGSELRGSVTVLFFFNKVMRIREMIINDHIYVLFGERLELLSVSAIRLP